MTTRQTPRILIVAGSDSGGGAGIQADIKTVTMLGGHAMTALTAITAQNTLGVQGVHPVPTDMVVAQMRSCIDDIGVDAVKIGMIASAATAHAVADVLEGLLSTAPLPAREGSGVGDERSEFAAGVEVGAGAPIPTPNPSLSGRGVPIVFDPVMVATSGSILADADTIAAFQRLIALATLVTPNLPELAALGGLGALATTVLVKGGHAAGDTVVDRLVGPGGEIARWSNPRIDTRHTHGTGCTLASAIATDLGAGLDLPAAIGRGIAFVRASLDAAPGLGAGHGPMGQQHATGLRCPD